MLYADWQKNYSYLTVECLNVELLKHLRQHQSVMLSLTSVIWWLSLIFSLLCYYNFVTFNFYQFHSHQGTNDSYIYLYWKILQKLWKNIHLILKSLKQKFFQYNCFVFIWTFTLWFISLCNFRYLYKITSLPGN